jgi:uncharacterized membrane protein
VKPPPHLTKQQAQKRADRIGAFRAELEALEQTGALILSEEQKESVRRHHETLLNDFAKQYDIDASQDQKQFSLGMRIASLLGAIAFCAAVFLFFYNYWGALSTPVQVMLLATAPVAMLIGVEFAFRKDRSLYFASMAAAVAIACFMLNLGALGHIFNITPSHNAFLAWALFSLLLAYTYGLRLPLMVGATCGIIYAACCLAVIGGLPWESFLMRPENLIPAGGACFAVGFFLPHRKHAGFLPILRSGGLIAFFFAFILLSIWGVGSYLYWSRDAIEICYQVIGFVLAGLTIWLGIRRGWTEVTYIGSSAFAILLFTKFFDWWWDWMPKYLFFLILGLVALGLLIVLKRLRRKGA